MGEDDDGNKMQSEAASSRFLCSLSDGPVRRQDERCPWEEQAEKLAEGSVAERPRKKAKTLVSQAPKQPKTPYILFLDAHHTLVKEQNPSFSFGELAEELRAMWHALLKVVPTLFALLPQISGYD